MNSVEREFRNQARQCIERAKELLAKDGEHFLRYAALEMRLAIEAVILARVAAFQDEINEHYLDAWHPRELLKHLLTLDPHIDKPSSLSVQWEDGNDDSWKTLGDFRPISLSELGKLHNSLGFFLHAPPLRNLERDGWMNMQSARKRASAAMKVLESVFATAFQSLNMKFSHFKFECERCGASNHILNLAAGQIRRQACQNPKCKAPHSLKRDGDLLCIERRQVPVRCAQEDCEHLEHFWTDEIRAASKWADEGLPALQWSCPFGHQNYVVMRNIYAPAKE